MKITIAISDELLTKVDERAKKMYISRSAYIATALTQKMQNDDAIAMMPELTRAINDALRMKECQEVEKVEEKADAYYRSLEP